MRSLFLSRLTAIWLLLALVTIGSWVVGHGPGLVDHRLAGVVALVIAMVKVRFVILDFMEIRHAPLWLRLAGEVWCAGLAIGLTTLFLIG
ncbi:MAG: cytochrome C oxidase subunit IV family protein [Zavarzinia sp.]|nr:cytochrome C oxidase subunit IV family protein [Zavarzinia sp.]